MILPGLENALHELEADPDSAFGRELAREARKWLKLLPDRGLGAGNTQPLLKHFPEDLLSGLLDVELMKYFVGEMLTRRGLPLDHREPATVITDMRKKIVGLLAKTAELGVRVWKRD